MSLVRWLFDHCLTVGFTVIAALLLVRWLLRPPTWKDGEGATGVEEMVNPPGL